MHHDMFPDFTLKGCLGAFLIVAGMGAAVGALGTWLVLRSL